MLAWKDLFLEIIESGTSTLYVVFGTRIATIGNCPYTVGFNFPPMRCRRESASLTNTKSPILKLAGSRLESQYFFCSVFIFLNADRATFQL